MDISKEAKAQIIANYYEDTCNDFREHIKIRGRMLLYTLAILWVNGLRLSGNSYDVKLTFLNKYVSPPIIIGGDWFNSLLCFILLCVSTRYFQVNVHINRRYDYIHELENSFANLLKCSLISREGKSYLSKYTWFSNYIDVVYTWIIPTMIIVFSLLSIINYSMNYFCKPISLEHSTPPFILCLVTLTMTITSTVLHVLSINYKR